MGVEIVTWAGRDVLDRLGATYDELAVRLGAPLTSRRPWLSVWVAANRDSTPLAVTARRDGRLAGAVLLATRETPAGVEVVGLGHGRNDRTRFLAETAEVAGLLAEGVADVLQDLPTWSLRIEQLPVDDPVSAAIAARVDGVFLRPGGSVPSVEFSAGRELDGHLSKNLRKQLRKCRNRMADDGVEMAMRFDRDPAVLLPLLDEVEAVHRGRDHAVGRSSDIDDPHGLALWRGVITRHIELGMVEIASMRLDGQLGAYVVSMLDGDTYRVLDGRFATEWERYSPGRILETETLRHAMEDEAFVRLDWMNSVAPDKLISSNALEATVHVVGAAPVDLDVYADAHVAAGAARR